MKGTRWLIAAAWVGTFAFGTCLAAEAPRECRFTYRPLTVGDQAIETLHVDIDLATTLVQDGQVVSVAEQAVERDEKSAVVRLAAAEGESARARITYESAKQTSQPRGGETSESSRPVDGKTYVAARQGAELVILDENGQAPPEDELAIVTRSMGSLGQPNPLGRFFDGRTIAVGQRVRLPAAFTEDLLSGWDESLVHRPVDVMLFGIERVDGKYCALFHTPPGAAERKEVAPIEGKLLIELDTCRVARLELRGPVAATERRGAAGQEFDLRRKGKLQVALHIEHLRAQ